jgi:hypothetical protein
VRTGAADRTTVEPVPEVEGMEMFGAVVPVTDSGNDAVTEVTVPEVAGLAQTGTPPDIVRS